MMSGSFSNTSSLVDALPYVDAGYDNPGVREAVMGLVEEEMKSYRPNKDYLAHLPPPDLETFQTDLMKLEFKRMDDGIPMEKLDFKKYSNIKPAINRRKDPAAWEECFSRVAILHNHMSIRLTNLQLQQDYGPEVWRRYIPTVERQFKQIDHEVKDMKNRIQAVNWERKNSQMKAGQKLHSLEERWVELIDKNFQIERSCLELEAMVAQMERAAADSVARKANQPTHTDQQTGNLTEKVDAMGISPSSNKNNLDQNVSQPEPL